MLETASEEIAVLEADIPPESGGFVCYQDYQETEFDWLETIPKHWRVRRLKYIASILTSNVDKHTKEDEIPVRLCNYTDVYNNEFIDERIDFMAATASADEIKKFQLKTGDVLVTKDSESADDIAVPACVVAELENTLCGYHLAIIRPKKNTSFGPYLLRAFQSLGLKDQFTIGANGVTRFGLSQHTIYNSIFPVPPLQEQKDIASFLNEKTGKIDELIAKKRRLIHLLEERLAAFTSQAVLAGLDPAVELRDSKIPCIPTLPKHWEIRRGKFLFRERDQRSTNGEEELLTVSHITGVTPRREKQNVNMFLASDMTGYKICQQGDVAINTMWAWMGALGVSKYLGIVSPSYNVYEPITDIDGDYYDLLFRTPAFIKEIIRFSKGVWTSRLRLYPEAFLNMRIPYPPIEEQRAIATTLRKMSQETDEKINKLSRSIDLLIEYRAALISAAVTGKIDVREAA